MENMSLNDNAQHKPNLKIAIRNDNDDDFDLLTHQHVSDDISEDPKGTYPSREDTLA